MKMLMVALRAAVYATAFIALWAWIAYWAHRQDDRLGIWFPEWPRGIGMGLMLIGAIIALLCIGTFVVRGRGTPAPFDAPREFVAAGPYRWMRNRMYVGGFLLLAGYALCAGSVAAMGVALAMLFAAHLFVLPYEEPTLEERFGETYRQYKRTTRRWMPRLPR